MKLGASEAGSGNMHVTIPLGLLTPTEVGNALEWELPKHRAFSPHLSSAPGMAGLY